jgi:predicted RNase H-like HicB family nuclease
VNEIVFLIEEDPEGGYTARALGEPIFTEGETVDEIREAIREALRAHFDDSTRLPSVIRLHFVKDEVIGLA